MPNGHKRSQSSITRFFLDKLPPVIPSPKPLSPTVVNEAVVSVSSSNGQSAGSLQEVPRLPSIEAFELVNILETIPETAAFESLALRLANHFKGELSEELEYAASEQDKITKDIQDVTRSAAVVLSNTQSKVRQLNRIIQKLHRTEQVATAAEQSYSTMTKIITKLEHLDKLLPQNDRLGTILSPHRHHYPQLHKLLCNRKRMTANNNSPSPSPGPPPMHLRTLAPATAAIDLSALPTTEAENISLASQSSTRTFSFNNLVRTFSTPVPESGGARERLQRAISYRP